MKTGRRFFLSGVAATLAGTRALLAGGQGQRGAIPLAFPKFRMPAIQAEEKTFPCLRGRIQKCSSRKTRKN